MLRPSILTSLQKISGYKVSMSRHSALCHDSGLRRCMPNKAGCGLQRRSSVHDRGDLSPTTELSVHNKHARATGRRS